MMYLHRIPTEFSTYIFSVPRSSQMQKTQTIFLTPGMYLILSSSPFSKFFLRKLAVIENCLIFSGFSKPFNISDYPFLTMCLSWLEILHISSFLQEANPISVLHSLPPLSQKGGHTQRTVIRLLICI